MGKKEQKISICVYLGILCLLILGHVFLYFSVQEKSATSSSYIININTPVTPGTKISMDSGIFSHWDDPEFHGTKPIGAQYDFIISNHMSEPMKDWTLVLELPDQVIVDSIWNCDYTLRGNQLICTPLEYNMTIAADDSTTFGCVMYSKDLLHFQSAVLTGYVISCWYDSPYFTPLCIATLIWAISFFIHITLAIRTKKYIKRHQKDSAIILQAMKTFASLIDAKDAYTKGHSIRVAIYASEIAIRMKIQPDEITTLYYIALMHDCGKMGIPDAVLNKPGKLTQEERDLIESHTTLGGKILENFTAISGIRDGALYHHERFDGTGYPQGLAGKDIPLYARIICVADAYDAMSSNRCYRRHIERPQIIQELKNNAGTQFDPDIVKYMLEMIDDGFVFVIQKEYPDTVSYE